MNCSQPGKQQIREHGLAKDRPQLRLIRVRKQSAVASSPCHQARQQTVRIPERTTDTAVREQALAMIANRPQTVRSLARSTSTISLLTKIGCEPRQAKNCPSRRIVVSMFPPASFPVHIRIIPAYVLI
jgi:hypothetical protein